MAISRSHTDPHGMARDSASQPASVGVQTALVSHLLYGLGDWIYSLAVVVLAYQLSGRLAVAAAVLLFQAGGRLIGVTLKPLTMTARLRSLAVGTGIVRALLIGSLVAVTERDQLWLAMLVAALLGISGPLTEGAWRVLSPAIRLPHQPRYLLARLVCRWDQIAMIAGSIAGGLAIVIWSERAAFTIAALLSLAAVLLLFRVPIPRTVEYPTRMRATDWRALRQVRAFQTLLFALAGGAALGIAIRVILVEIVLDLHDGSELVYGLFIALAGVGAFAGPLSVPRLLAKLPSEIILAGVTVALAMALIAARIADPLALIIPVILGCGLLAITGERVTETVARRVVPDRQLDGALRLLAIAAVAGQAVALALVIAFDYLSGITLVVIGLAAVGILVSGLSVLLYMSRRSSTVVTIARDGR